MAFTSYLTINGKIHGEVTGGVATGFATDALGSVTATVDNTGAVANTYRYKPYGATLAKTGSSADPKYQWVGSYGYRITGRTQTESYVRARHYGQKAGIWTTIDELMPCLNWYLYVYASPVLNTDSSGLFPDFIGCGDYSSKLKGCCDDTSRLSEAKVRDAIKICMKKIAQRAPSFSDSQAIDHFLDLLSNICKKGGKDNPTCIRCSNGDMIPNWPDSCKNPCAEGYWGYSYPDASERTVPKDPCGLTGYYEDPGCGEAFKGTNGKPCSCSIVLCEKGLNNVTVKPCALLYHELSHCSGLGHSGGEKVPGIKVPRELDFIYKLGCCVCLTLKGNTLKGNDECGEECKRLL